MSGLICFEANLLVCDFPRQDSIHGLFDAGKEGFHGVRGGRDVNISITRKRFVPSLQDEAIWFFRLGLRRQRSEGSGPECNHGNKHTAVYHIELKSARRETALRIRNGEINSRQQSHPQGDCHSWTAPRKVEALFKQNQEHEETTLD